MYMHFHEPRGLKILFVHVVLIDMERPRVTIEMGLSVFWRYKFEDLVKQNRIHGMILLLDQSC